MNLRNGLVLFAMTSFIGIPATWAQTVSGTLMGRVYDASGGVVPGVSIEAREEQTRAVRTTITTEDGLYKLAFVPIGRYTLTFTMPGFKTLIRPGIEVMLNNTSTVDAKLEVATQSETVTVTSEVPQIDTTTGELKTSFDERHIEDKPILNRNMLSLVNDVPGFQTNPVSGQNNPTASSGSSVQINGTGTRSATFQTDGVNNDDSSENQHRQTVNISSIKEFQVLRNSFTAEFGRGAGAVVLVQTKNGTNTFHGDAYWYTQNNVFNAQSYFGNLAGARKGAVHRHIYGGTVGGPIRKDKAFFFQSFERTWDKGAGLTTRDILLPEERSVDPATNLSAVDQAWIKGIIDRFPNALPNSPNLGIRAYSALVGRNWPAGDYATRIDLPMRGNKNLMFRYQLSHQIFDNADTMVRGEATKQDNRQQNFGMTYTHSFSPKTVGEFRFALGRRRTTVNIKDGNETPIVRFSGLARGTTLGSSGVFPILRYQTDFQYVYNWSTLLTSKNALRAGTDIRRQQLNDRADQFSRGFWTFGIAQGRTAIENFRRGFVGSFTKSWGPNFLGNRGGEFNFYIQDDWKPRRNLTVNVGARFEHVLKLSEVNNLLDYGFGSDTYVEPRFGFAWSPSAEIGFLRAITGGPGRFVIRGGAGFFHGRIYQSSLSQNGASIRFNPPNALTQSYSNVSGSPADPSGGFVFVPGTIPTVRYQPTWVDSRLRMPYTEQWNLTIERQFPKRISISASYTGNRGIGLILYDSVNRAEFPIRAPDHPNVSAANRGIMMDCIDPNLSNTNPAPGCISLSQPRYNDRRPDPRYTGILRVFNGSWSYYHGLQISVVKRYSAGLTINANYTLSKAIDTGSEATFTGLDLGSSTNGKNSAAALRGLSLYNQVHRMVVNYSYRVPFFSKASPFLKQVFRGWQVSGTTTFNSGNPFTITSGYDVNSDGSSSDRPNLVNPAILGLSIDNPRYNSSTGKQISQTRILPTDFFPNAATNFTQRVFLPGGGNQGNLGRNSFFVHGVNNWDVAISKTFRIREGHGFIVRMELYNAMNRTQWGYPNRSALNSENIFMTITGARAFTNPRTGQFVLRYTF